MIRSNVHRIGASLVACALAYSGVAVAESESLFENKIAAERADQFLELGALDRKVEVFVRLDRPSVAKLNIANIEANGVLLDSSVQKAAAEQISREQAPIIAQLEALGGETKAQMRVGANGIRTVISRSQLSRVADIPGVRAVSRVDTHIIGNHFNSVPWMGAPAVWESVGDGENISIGIIDTGIDYYHANFGGSGDVAQFDADDTSIVEPGSFPTAKVIGGMDFVGDAYNGSNTPVPDPDPLDCNGHGSHVAGSAAGLGVSDIIGPGVAKGADLYALRVFGCDGSTRETSAAIEWAMDPNGDGDMSDHLDVINMSLGSSNGYPNDPTAIASDNAARAGVIVVASAGNSGDAPYITGSPGVAARAISVSAYSSGGDVPAIGFSGDQNGAVEYIESSSPLAVTDNPTSGTVAIAPASGTTGVRDGCAPFDDDMTGKIALISRGGCAFIDKANNAAAQGAVAIIVHNDGADANRIAPLRMNMDGATIPGVMIASFSGQAISEAIAEGAVVNAVLDGIIMTPTEFGDSIASFSSRGPGSGGSGFKPDLGSSGVNITSALVGSGSGPLTISGTSMSAPHVAGAAALLKQVHPNINVGAIEAVLQNSTRDSNPINSIAGPFPLSRGGVGVVDVAKAVSLTSLARPGGVSFGRFDKASDSRFRRSVRLQSLSGGARSFDVTHRPNQQVPGVTVNCGGPVAVSGDGYDRGGLTNISMQFDVSAMPLDFGASSQQEVDGHCVFSDGKDVLRVGYMAVVDAGTLMYAATRSPGQLRVVNPKEAAGFVQLFTQVGSSGDLLDGASHAIDAVGFRTPDPADFFGFNVVEFGVATEAPWDSLMSHEIDIEIDADFDGIPEALLILADRGLFTARPALTGEMVTIQIDLVNGGGFLDWSVPGIDFNDRAGYFAFTKQSSGGLVPEKFAYTMMTFGPDGGVDTQSGVVDTAAEIVPEVGGFGLLPRTRVDLEVDGAGDVLALFTNNIPRKQKRTITVQ